MTASERDEAIRALLPLVRHIARRVLCVARAADLDDLIGDGSIGLIRAVDSFDPARGIALDVYARKLIAGAMLNGLRRLDPVSERVRRTIRQAEERRYSLAQEFGTLPSYAELEATDGTLRRARAAAYRQAALSLDAPAPHGPKAVADYRDDPAHVTVERAKRRELDAAVELLPERQRRILAMHYGAELSLRAIGARLFVSPQRVSQLHLSALTRLRHTVTAS